MASGTTVGTAVIKLTFDGKDVKASLNNVENTVKKKGASIASLGKETGSKWATAWAVAAGNIISKGISKITSVISSGFSSAISRIDTLDNFPKVMTALGYSAEEANSSVSKISDALDGLPTTLDGAINDVQKLAATMGNLDQGMVNATSVGLALNDMFLAGGKGTEAASMAMEQYNQMLANGKVDMQSWRSMVNAAPGQMKQLAQSLVGATADSQDLYEAMKEGTVTFDQFNEALVRLDKEGGESFSSFNSQAVAATQGLETQLKNINTSLTKFIGASIKGNVEQMDTYSNQLVNRISAVLPQLINGFANAFTGLAKKMPDFLNMVMNTLKVGLPQIVQEVVHTVPMIIEEVSKQIPSIVHLVAEIGKTIVLEIPNILSSLLDAVNELINSLIEELPAILTTLIDSLMMTVDLLLERLPDFVNGIIEFATQAVMMIAEHLPEILTTIVNGIMEIAIMLTQPENLQKILQAGLTLLLKLVEAIPQVIIAIIDALPSIIENIIAFLTDPANIMMIIEAAVKLFFGLVEAVPRILGALIGAFGKLVGDLWNGITQMFGEFAANFGNFIGDIFRGAINGILTFIENFINGPIDILNGFIGAINWAFGFIGVNLEPVERIKLPRLAEGGIALDETIAMIGEEGKEAVIPLENNTDNWAGMLADILVEKMDEGEETTGTSGRAIEVNMVNQINNEMDAQDIGRVMMQSIRRAA